jgi:glycosyltransferase involved in cell wall biosynthesis
MKTESIIQQARLSAHAGASQFDDRDSASTQVPDSGLAYRQKFDEVLKRIEQHGSVDASEILPYLCQDRKILRAEANLRLGKAFLAAGNHQQARVFVERAWMLSDFSPEVMPIYKDILMALGDTRAIREAYKILGIMAADRGDFVSAILNFDLFQYAYGNIDRVDRYEYDFDVFDALHRVAQLHRFDSQVPSIEGRKLRIGYLLRGVTDVSMNLMIISSFMAEFHDRSRFDVQFFSLDPPERMQESADAQKWIARFRELGYEITSGPPLPAGANYSDWVLSAARVVHESHLDVLVTSMAPGSFMHYFVGCLRPAPILVGLVQGAPGMYAAPGMDWCISWSEHPLMDTPVDCSLVRLKQRCPRKDDVRGYSKAELGIPDDAVVLLAAGRMHKFQGKEQWQVMAELLERFPQMHYAVVGCEAHHVDFLDSLLPQAVFQRIHFLGWRPDFPRILAAADLVVDTYPDGAGQVILEAMAMEKPIVAFRNDFMIAFDMRHWSPVECFIDDQELVLARGDWNGFKRVVSQLITDTDYRTQMAARCLDYAKQAKPELAVAQCEEIYAELIALRSYAGLISKG